MPTHALAHALARLLEPIGPDAFFAQHWERAPVHLVSASRRARPLLEHDALFEALIGRETSPEGLMLFPEHLGRGPIAERDLLGDRSLFQAYVDAGHPIVWSRARGVFPEVDALSRALSEAFGAHVWPNVYATGSAGTPFEMHFDCHEVFAVHCAGRKSWTISEVRVDRPLDAADMEATVRAVMQARRAEAERRVAHRYAVAPGDVVYIPRGQFHNAAAEGARSLHITFGVRLPSGHDVTSALARVALADPALREYLPPIAADLDGARAAAQIEDIRARLATLIAGSALDRVVADLRAYSVDQSTRARSS